MPHLEANSEWLQQQLEQYKPISKDFQTIFCYETRGTRVNGVLKEVSAANYLTLMLQAHVFPSQIVPRHSAVVPGAVDVEEIAIHKDHIQMVKFESADEDSFRRISWPIHSMVMEAPTAIEGNWRKWDQVKGLF